MKKVETTITYKVPHWNFCNVDRFDYDLTPSPQKCQFCKPSGRGYECMIYNEILAVKGDKILKAHACCRTTCGAPSNVDMTIDVPDLEPKQIMRSTIDLYTKAVDSLVNKGYPRTMAEQAAKKYILEE